MFAFTDLLERKHMGSLANSMEWSDIELDQCQDCDFLAVPTESPYCRDSSLLVNYQGNHRRISLGSGC